MIEDSGVPGDKPGDRVRTDAPHTHDGLERSTASGSAVSRSAYSKPRLAFASVFAVVVLSTLSLFAGAGFASSGTGTGGIGQKSSADDQYELGVAVQPPKKTTVVVKGTATSTPTSTASTTATSASGGTLPFTGLSLIGTLALGGALVGIGIALRRRDARE